MSKSDRIFIAVLIALATGWLVAEFCRPRYTSAPNEAVPKVDEKAVPLAEQPPTLEAAPPLMAMLPTVAE